MEYDIPQGVARQVQVQFITNFPDIELPEGKRQLLVPTSMVQAFPILEHKLSDY